MRFNAYDTFSCFISMFILIITEIYPNINEVNQLRNIIRCNIPNSFFLLYKITPSIRSLHQGHQLISSLLSFQLHLPFSDLS